MKRVRSPVEAASCLRQLSAKKTKGKKKTKTEKKEKFGESCPLSPVPPASLSMKNNISGVSLQNNFQYI